MKIEYLIHINQIQTLYIEILTLYIFPIPKYDLTFVGITVERTTSYAFIIMKCTDHRGIKISILASKTLEIHICE